MLFAEMLTHVVGLVAFLYGYNVGFVYSFCAGKIAQSFKIGGYFLLH